MMNKAYEASRKVNKGSTEPEGSFKGYVKEWESLFVGENYLQRLKSSAVKGDLKFSNFRSISWKLFLECLPEDCDVWIECTKSHRQHYEEIVDKVLSDPRYTAYIDDVTINNPLSLAQENPWNQFYKDEDLRKTIQQDVIRTFPEIKFFQSKDIQKLMINILFSYAKQVPHLSYKQGMHELLAPIIYVLSHDIKLYLVAAKTESLDLKIHFLLNQNYLEHDAFSLFCNLMKVVEPWYSINISPSSKMPYFDHGNQLAVKLKEIHEHLLKKFDSSLYIHLENMEIIPQIYGIRWLRLLFGREFPINDLLGMWDVIFSDNCKTFELVDFIFVAMLISIRQPLLDADYSTCLRHLMRYPNSVEARSIIRLAFRLREADLMKKEGVSLKTESFVLPGVLKDVKQNMNKTFTKSIYPGVAKPMKALSSVKDSENRPKTLSLPHSFWGLSLNPVSDDMSREKDIPPTDDSDEGSWDVIEETDYLVSKRPITFPLDRIQSVMEKRTDKCDSSEASLAIENLADRTLGDKKTVGANPLKLSGREMFPLRVPSPSRDADTEQSTEAAKIHSEVEQLRLKLSELLALNENCSQLLSVHVDRIKTCMIGQNLKQEDDIQHSLTSIQKVSDSLKDSLHISQALNLDSKSDSISTPVSCCPPKSEKYETFSEENESAEIDGHQSSKPSFHQTQSEKLKENMNLE